MCISRRGPRGWRGTPRPPDAHGQLFHHRRGCERAERERGACCVRLSAARATCLLQEAVGQGAEDAPVWKGAHLRSGRMGVGTAGDGQIRAVEKWSDSEQHFRISGGWTRWLMEERAGEGIGLSMGPQSSATREV
ncbi:hypothetical protein AAFF_G00190810 [Aldrovandia affinis]|uniref:Uncharacterized protein n=1 Tax=Aldrovandia affinis TaxID=143900 RepID=A0AAD7RJK3_9TELE|nr:hypothetical protein AAFF_G00190810 [Aldrovandia affinis]